MHLHTWCKEKLFVDKNDDKKLHLRGTTNRNLKTAVALFGFACLPFGAGRPELQTTDFSADKILIRLKKTVQQRAEYLPDIKYRKLTAAAADLVTMYLPNCQAIE